MKSAIQYYCSMLPQHRKKEQKENNERRPCKRKRRHWHISGYLWACCEYLVPWWVVNYGLTCFSDFILRQLLVWRTHDPRAAAVYQGVERRITKTGGPPASLRVIFQPIEDQNLEYWELAHKGLCQGCRTTNWTRTRLEKIRQCNSEKNCHHVHFKLLRALNTDSTGCDR
jgi:hypothetical protein